MENAVPVWRWQSVQWHAPCITGAAAERYVTLPQRQ
jgi:hypothetical protein